MLVARASFAVCSFLLAGSAVGQVTAFQGDYAGWAAAAGSLRTLITFDDFSLASGASAAISPDHYAGLTLTGVPSTPGSGLPFALNPNATDRTNGVAPVSESNVLQLTSTTIRNGILEVTFASPVIAFGGYFIDVETAGAARSTGIWSNADDKLYAYTSSFTNGGKVFIGIVSSTPFSKAQIRLASTVDPSVDGVAFDNMEYAVPAPGVTLVMGVGGCLIGRRRR